MKTKQTCIRRSPAELIADLEARLTRMGEASDKVAGRIDRLRKRYASSLELASFADVPAEQLQAQLDEAKKTQRLIRAAVKAKRGAP